MRSPFFLLLLLSVPGLHAQNVFNINCTSPEAAQVMKGLYDPANYAASTVIGDHQVILCEMRWLLSTDSLKAHLQRLEVFHTRNSYSDTVSNTSGIGAARRWAHSKFQQFSAANDGRLIPAYLQFDVDDPDSLACGDAHGWRNVLGVLPGANAGDPGLIVIEAHLDSRCAGNCDIDCPAPGMEDNGSGSALVIELARVMSRYTFDHTIVFMLTTGEEQGLLGAEAMATWCVDNDIAIKGVQNNDIVGGVICGQTSSPPSCEPPGSVDSMEVRLFANGSLSSPHRGFARTVKMWYEEKLQTQVAVPMTVSVMGQEDRDGRGGDHIPFRAAGYRNVRFTSANEHGDANVEDSTYIDHQHTSGDVLGVDTDGDVVVDSFFVDFDYLQRNTLINGMAAALLALGPEPPEIVVNDEPGGLRVSIDPVPGAMAYRIGVRQGSLTVDFAAVYRTTDTSFVIPGLDASTSYIVSAASIDSAGIMSPFGREWLKSNDAATSPGVVDDLPFGIDCWGIGMPEQNALVRPAIELRPPQPNPFEDRTRFEVLVGESFQYHEAYLLITDAQGRGVARVPITLALGLNSASYQHRGGAGPYTCSLVVDGRMLTTQGMVVVK